MPAAAWVALVTAFLGTVGVIVAAKVNGRSTLTTSLDARAAKVLEDAMDYQGREIVSLRQRVDDLEAEVAPLRAGEGDATAAVFSGAAGSAQVESSSQ